MKNKAFTLAEVLITLGIVGVVAALTISGIAKLKPDESKVKYMNAYNSLANLAPEIVNDETLFPKFYDDSTGKLTSAGLVSLRIFNALDRTAIDPIYFKDGMFTLKDGKVSDTITNPYLKFDYLLSRRLNASDFKINPKVTNSSIFTTPDGIIWTVQNEPGSIGSALDLEGSPNYRKMVTIDINGDKAPNCTYNASSCKKPDQFIFYVAMFGDVQPGDKLGQAFLMNSSDMHNIDKDRAKANSL